MTLAANMASRVYLLTLRPALLVGDEPSLDGDTEGPFQYGYAAKHYLLRSLQQDVAKSRWLVITWEVMHALIEGGFVAERFYADVRLRWSRGCLILRFKFKRRREDYRCRKR